MKQRLLVLAILFGLPSCATVLRAPGPPPPEHINFRDTYLAKYPEITQREAILAGELRRGMSPAQVYLAWGAPLHRIKGEGVQRWIYEYSEPGAGEEQPSVVTHLFFKGDKLVRWRRDRHYVDFRDTQTESELGVDLRDLPQPDGAKAREP